MTAFRSLAFGLCTSLALLAAERPAQADAALFTFGEMVRLHDLPQRAASTAPSDEDIILYQNMEFYTFTVFETLMAANSVVAALKGEPIFCAPAGTFSFKQEGDITALSLHVIEELLVLIKEAGAAADRYDDRPASDVLLMGLRAAYPCADDMETASAMR